MKGRKPKLVAVEGGADPAGCPGPPDWLAEHARSEWWRAAPELYGRGLLARDVLCLLENYCVAAGTIRECEETMQRDGRMIEGPHGTVIHPAHRIQAVAMKEARLLACELGLSPHRRPKAEPKGDEDRWAGMVG